MLKCFADWAKWDEVAALEADKKVRKIVREHADADELTWTRAESRVCIDGYYGPFSDEDWSNMTGYDPISVKEALKIVRKGIEAPVPDFEYFNPDYDFEPRQDEEGTPNYLIEESEIKRELFSWYREIYGT